MLRHVVLLRFGPDTPEAHLDVVVAALRDLPGAIPAIRRYEVARDLGLADDNADLVVVAHFDDVAGYELYRDHPEHRRVIDELIAPHLDARIATQTGVGAAG